MTVYDVIVLGLGAMGSAASYQLAKRGARVLGLEQFRSPHARGSSHGETRITRLAIGEGEHYTPLAMRSHEIWRELERETGRSLLTVTGGLVISSAAKKSLIHVPEFFANTVASARQYGIAHELLDAREIRTRFPVFNVRDDEYGYYEPAAGFLRPELCIASQLEMAVRSGADLHMEEQVHGFESAAAGVTVTTNCGSYNGRKLIVAAGAWLPALLGARYPDIFRVTRQVLYWYDIADRAASFAPGACPIFIWEIQNSGQGIYGFPAIDGPKGGLKIASGQYDTETTPDTIDRTVTQAQMDRMYRDFVAPHIEGLSPECVKSEVCLYTVTPDAGFVIDTHPDMPDAILCSACSGHGFKHSAAIGEALAEQALYGHSSRDLRAFRLRRFLRS